MKNKHKKFINYISARAEKMCIFFTKLQFGVIICIGYLPVFSRSLFLSPTTHLNIPVLSANGGQFMCYSL